MDGEFVSQLPEAELPALRRASFGFVFQAYHLFPFLTAAENVEAGLRLRRVAPRQCRATALELLERCGMSHRAAFRPRDLSGGEKQRVALARALAGDPLIIIADEPTASLDQANGEAALNLLRTLARDSGKAVVMASHDPKARDFADQVLALRDGRVVHGDDRPR